MLSPFNRLLIRYVSMTSVHLLKSLCINRLVHSLLRQMTRRGEVNGAIKAIMGNHYETLGVSRSCTAAEIREAFNALIKLHHPDRNSNSHAAKVRTQQIINAYNVLRDQKSRDAYDKTLPAPTPPAAAAPRTRTPPPTSSAVPTAAAAKPETQRSSRAATTTEANFANIFANFETDLENILASHKTNMTNIFAKHGASFTYNPGITTINGRRVGDTTSSSYSNQSSNFNNAPVSGVTNATYSNCDNESFAGYANLKLSNADNVTVTGCTSVKLSNSDNIVVTGCSIVELSNGDNAKITGASTIVLKNCDNVTITGGGNINAKNCDNLALIGCGHRTLINCDNYRIM